MPPHRDRSLEPLGPAEARTLLAGADLGRLAFTEGALPAVQPVRMAVRDDVVVIATSPGSAVALAARGSVVAVQADSFDALTGTGWSVTAVGPARLLRDPDEAALLDVAHLDSWVPGAARCHVLVSMGLVTGHRVVAAPRPCTPPREGEDVPRAS